jgi:hypothetical protein
MVRRGLGRRDQAMRSCPCPRTGEAGPRKVRVIRFTAGWLNSSVPSRVGISVGSRSLGKSEGFGSGSRAKLVTHDL